MSLHSLSLPPSPLLSLHLRLSVNLLNTPLSIYQLPPPPHSACLPVSFPPTTLLNLPPKTVKQSLSLSFCLRSLPPPPPYFRSFMLRRECNLLTAVKGFKVDLEASQTLKAVLSAQVCARGCDWLESVALLLSVSEHDRVDVMALGGAKISMM